MDESPQLYYLIVPVSLGAVFGLFFGLLASWDVTVNRQYWIVGASVLFSFFGWRLSDWFIRKREQWVFFEYSTDTPVQQVVERVTLSITIEGIGTKLIHGFTREEIRALGQCVTHNNTFTFNVAHFKDYFKTTDTDGYSLYSKSVRRFKDAGALVPNAKGGVDVSEIGEQLFICLRDGSWEEIKEMLDVPFPDV